MNLKAISLQRKRVHLLRLKRGQLEKILMGRSAMVAASFMPRRLKPGGHVVYYLSTSIQGESRHRYIRKGGVGYWRKRAQAWRRFSQAMASWVKVHKQIEEALREIGRSRCESLPGGGGRRGRRRAE